MRKNKVIIGILATTFFGMIATSQIMAGTTTAGSSADPLVSKSYVDGRVNEILNAMNSSGSTPKTGSAITGTVNLSDDQMKQIVTTVVKQIEVIYGDNISRKPVPSVSPSSSTVVNNGSNAYAPVSAKQNQVIVLGEGSEVILRSGSAVGYVKVANGLVNMTTGQEVSDGGKIPIDNLIIIPRDDGRGVKITSDIAWFIIKGSYHIVG